MRSQFLHLSSFKLALLITIGVLWLYLMNFQALSFLDKKWVDFLMRIQLPVPHRQEVFIAAVDAKSIDQYGRWPWPRSRMAELIESLTKHYGVRTIGIDIVFSEQDLNTENDILLANTIREAENVITGYYLLSKSGYFQLDQIAIQSLKNSQISSEIIEKLSPLRYHIRLKWEPFRTLLLKYLTQEEYDSTWRHIFKATHLHPWHNLTPEQTSRQVQSLSSSVPDIVLGQRFLKNALIPEGWAAETNIAKISSQVKSQGHFSAFLDNEDGILRRIQAVMLLHDRLHTSLDLQILKHFLGASILKVRLDQYGIKDIQLDEKIVETEKDGSLLLNYKGGRDTFDTYSIVDLIDHKISKESLQDRIALVGITEMGILDTYVTPTEHLYPGVEVHATALDNMLSSTYLRVLPNLRLKTFFFLIFFGLFLSVLVSRFSFRTVSIISLTGIILIIGIQFYLLHAAHLWTGIVYSLLLVFSIWISQNLFALFSAEKEKRAAQKLSYEIIHNAPISIFTTDIDGRIIYENPSARRMFQYQKAQSALGGNLAQPNSLFGKTIGDPELMSKILRGEEGIRQFTKVRYQSAITKASLIANIFIAPLRKGTEIEGAIVQFEDITETEKAEQAREQAQQETLKQKQIALENLQKADKLKDQFLANTSHELRTPLNGIIGLGNSLLDGIGGGLSDVQVANLKMIVQSGQRLAHLVNDILDESKMKNRELQLFIGPVNICNLVEDVFSLVQPLIGAKALSLISKIPDNCCWVQADENRLQQILLNLIENGIKFSHQGEVVVQVQQEKEWNRVSVSDSGIGIPEGSLERIFNVFEQLDGSIEREFGGTGLGLSISKKLLELHGSSVDVKSTVGVGTTFSFLLPRSEKQSHEQFLDGTKGKKIIGSLNAGLQQSGENQLIADACVSTGVSKDKPWITVQRQMIVLVVDDEPVNLQVVKNQLTLHNYDAITAENGYRALEMLEKEKPDLILLDVMMPGINGYEVCARIRESHSAADLPVILLTAKNQVEDLVQAFQSGANDYLVKPFHEQELIARITAHAEIARMNQAIGRFVPHNFLHFLNKESIAEVKLGDHVQKEMSILFSDIRSFSMLSEKMTPQETFQFIISYLSQMGPLVRKYEGFVDKYVGDAIMALFSSRADDAVLAAIAMIRLLDEYNEGRSNAGYDSIRIGIGINTGSLMLGAIGEEDRLEETVLSDAVNLASRIEGMTKVYDTNLLISEYTYQNLINPGEYAIRLIDRVKVKDKADFVALYEVFDADPPKIRDSKWASAPVFEQARTLYEQQNFSEAAALFGQCSSLSPLDHVVQLYIERCKLRVNANLS
ncbi:MAG: CHASE2 domain-containing protein [SAR324 cluster bacterium]|nr:CHASE2 domain-containing protein [SAR324 cluster bacterium]